MWTRRLLPIALLPLHCACAARAEPQVPAPDPPPVVVSVSPSSSGSSGELRPDGANASQADGEVTDEEVAAARKRERDRQIAQQAGVLGLLQAADGMESPFGASAIGADPDALGGLVSGKAVGEAYGTGGLGLRGVGRGGGGTGEGIGLGQVGTIGRSGGTGAGYGRGAGRLGSSRNARPPAVTTGHAKVRGMLDEETIRRVIRRHVPPVRYCYERQLAKDPNLQGRLGIEFAIGQDGRVTAVKVVGPLQSELDRCVARVVRRMVFPKPEGGIVVVSYPFVFRAGNASSPAPSAPAPATDETGPPNKGRAAPERRGK